MTTPFTVATPWWLPAARIGDGARPQGDVQPDWARFAEEAIRAGGGASHVRDDDAFAPGSRAAAETMFAPVVAPFVDAALRSIAVVGAVDGSLLAGVGAELSVALRRTVSRVMVAEIRLHLGGHGNAADVTALVCRAATPAGLRELLNRYPVLGRLLAQQAMWRADAVTELLRRLEADRSALIAHMFDGRDPGPAAELRFGLGDTHRHGRSVVQVRFSDDAVVIYKPRSLEVHRVMSDIMRSATPALRELLGAEPELFDLPVLCRAGYGWMAFEPGAVSVPAAQVHLFYRRFGAALALMHAFGTVDIHLENVIVAPGGVPVFFDLETVAHPELRGVAVTDPAATWLAESVMRTDVLPALGRGADLSALYGGVDLHGEIVGYDDPGLPTMSLRRRIEAVPGAASRPVVDGVAVDPANYLDDFTAGFVAGYDALLALRAELCRPGGLLDRLGGLTHRVLVRTTRTYLRLLDECTHPAALVDHNAREEVLERVIREAPGIPDTLSAEISQLWDGDVPVFESRADEAGVFAPCMKRPVLRTDETPRQLLHRRFAGMDVDDRDRQVWLIRAAVGAHAQTPSHARSRLSGCEDGEFDPLVGAVMAGDLLLARAHMDGARCSWVTVHRDRSGAQTVRPMNIDFANGSLGVGLFLAELARCGGASRHENAAAAAVGSVIEVLEKLADDTDAARSIGVGMFSGFGGIAYAAGRLATLIDLPGWSRAVDLAVGLLIDGFVSTASDDLGYANGTTGGLLGLLSVAGTGNTRAQDALGHAADIVMRDVSRRLELDADDGHRGAIRSSTALALGRASRALSRPELRELGTAVLSRGDLRPEDCLVDGPAGVSVARADLTGAGVDPRPTQPAEDAASAVACANDCLATGTAGLIDLDPSTPTVLGRRLPLAGGLFVPGLHFGLAGIGHALLRRHAPLTVPSILTVSTTTVSHHLRGIQ